MSIFVSFALYFIFIILSHFSFSFYLTEVRFLPVTVCISVTFYHVFFTHLPFSFAVLLIKVEFLFLSVVVHVTCTVVDEYNDKHQDNHTRNHNTCNLPGIQRWAI